MMRHRLCQEGWTTKNFTGKKLDNPEDKKIGAESSDPNRHSQPRLPGSVVGDASMRQTRFPSQDYRGHCPEVTTGNFPGILYFAATSECVIACTDSAIRFCTPTLRINFAT